MFVNTHLWPSHYERRKESLFVQVIMCFLLLVAKCLPRHEKKKTQTYYTYQGAFWLIQLLYYRRGEAVFTLMK